MREITEDMLRKYEDQAAEFFPTIFKISSKFIIKARESEVCSDIVDELIYHHQLIITYLAAIIMENPEVEQMHELLSSCLTKEQKNTSKAYYDFTDGYLYDGSINLRQIVSLMDDIATKFVYAVNDYHSISPDFNLDYFEYTLCETIKKIKKYNDQPNSNLSSKQFTEVMFVKALEKEMILFDTFKEITNNKL